MRYDLDAQATVSALHQLMLTPEYFCSRTIKVCPQKYEEISLEDDIIEILKDMPEDAPGYVNAQYEMFKESEVKRETVKFIHFSDAHLDMGY